jgi:Xaa-Pro aminopeptidase
VLTGYWPVVGDSIAICVRGGPSILLVPEDELELADQSFADSVETFVPETLHSMTAVSEAVKPRLADIFSKLKMQAGLIGVDSGAGSQATSYLAVHLYGNELPNMLHDLLPNSTLTPIEEWVQKLKSIKTTFELARIREACAIAKGAYERAAPQLRAGMTEFDARNSFARRSAAPTLANLRCNGGMDLRSACRAQTQPKRAPPTRVRVRAFSNWQIS